MTDAPPPAPLPPFTPPLPVVPVAFLPTSLPAEPREREWNVLAIVAICFVPFASLVSVITGHIALTQIRRIPRRGHTLALLAVIFGYLGVVASIIVSITLVAAAIYGSTLDDNGNTPPTGTKTPTPWLKIELQVGDCLAGDKNGDLIVSKTGVPCDEPHYGEVFFDALIPDGDGTYPAAATFDTFTLNRCVDSFTTFTGSTLEETRLEYSYVFPSRAGWKGGDRHVLCLAFDTAGPVTGTLKSGGPSRPFTTSDSTSS